MDNMSASAPIVPTHEEDMGSLKPPVAVILCLLMTASGILLLSPGAWDQDAPGTPGATATIPSNASVVLLFLATLALVMLTEFVGVVLWKKQRIPYAVWTFIAGGALLLGAVSYAYHTTERIIQVPRLSASRVPDRPMPAVSPFDVARAADPRAIRIAPATLAAGDVTAGRQSFLNHCAACHQTDGMGIPDYAPSIRNKFLLSAVDDDFLVRTIRLGRSGTAMLPHLDLPDQTLADLIAFLRSVDTASEPVTPLNWKPPGPVDSQAGQTLFAMVCAACHADHGGGYRAGGKAPAIGGKDFLNVATDDYIARMVKDGRGDTPMPAFAGVLTDQQIADIIAFLRSPNRP